MRTVETRRLKTPARVCAAVETGTDYGGQVVNLVPGVTIWGEFRPDVPVVETPSDEEAFVVQAAVFLCRWADGVVRGTVLRIGGFDWTVTSVSEDADGIVLLQVERVHG